MSVAQAFVSRIGDFYRVLSHLVKQKVTIYYCINTSVDRALLGVRFTDVVGVIGL
jgi:hypothetical protein